ncbi:MAG: hypothetical protein AAFV80_21940 [Bacteroidota bacterium]
MEQDIILQEKLIRYLQNDLPEGERTALQQQIDQSTELQTALQELQTILTGFKAIQVKQLDEQLETWENNMDQPDEGAELYTKVQAYLDGTMLETERLAFEKRIKDLPDNLKTILRDLEHIHSGFKGIQADDLKADMQNWEAAIQQKKEAPPLSIKPPQKPQIRVLSLWQKVAVAAALFGSILALVILLQPRSSAMDRLMADAKVNYQIPNVRSGDTVNPLHEGFLFFQQKDFHGAVVFFTEKLADTPSDEDVLRWTAYANFEDGAFSLAAEQFQQLADLESIRFSEEAAYMYALSLLPNNEEQGVAALQAIAKDTNHEFQADAQKVVDKLGKR